MNNDCISGKDLPLTILTLHKNQRTVKYSNSL